ncbi:MAG: hypothetical protein NTY77_03810 [Elusimicrobia bacterium]|nr:hypothetical protein [Elusimicrobiota bacterium]
MKDLPRWLTGTIIAVLSFQLAACGTILYPERKGQRDGRLDIGVVLLDAIGLLFFIIPGVIAYAVDFTNGTIYLPGTKGKSGKAGLDRRDIRTVRFDPKRYTPELLGDLIRRETGYDIDWRDPRLQVVKLKTTDEIPGYFAQAGQTMPIEPSLLSGR